MQLIPQPRIEPLLYRTLVIGGTGKINGVPACSVETFTRVARTKPAPFLRDAVRHLMLNKLGKHNTRFILSTCPAVDNLFILVSTPLRPTNTVPTIESMAPARLYCHLENVFALTHRVSFHHPVFSQLTHLEIFGEFVEGDPSSNEEHPPTWTNLGSLPCLTHLALNPPHLVAICPKIFAACPDLRALLILNALFDDPAPAELEILAEEPRFVVLPLSNYVDDWVRGAITGMDYWACADVFIAKRISGEIKRE
jgi:hypothetical protein